MMRNSWTSRKCLFRREMFIQQIRKKKNTIPPTILYTKSCGCAGDNELATVKMCVIFLPFSASLLLAAPMEPKKRPYEVIKNPIKPNSVKKIKAQLNQFQQVVSLKETTNIQGSKINHQLITGSISQGILSSLKHVVKLKTRKSFAIWLRKGSSFWSITSKQRRNLWLLFSFTV